MTKISKSGIAPLQQIKSEHLIRIINALDGTAPNTTIEVSGSVTASYFVGDGSKLTNIATSSYSENTEVDYTIISGSTKPIAGGAVREGILTKQDVPTGFISGLILSIKPGDATKGIIGTGSYAVTDYSDFEDIKVYVKNVISPIEFTPQYLFTGVASYIALDTNMNVIQSAAPFDNADRRTLALIGATIHSDSTIINAVNEIKAPIMADTNQLHDFMKAIGSLNLYGNNYYPSGSNLNINKTSGAIWGLGINANDFEDPHRLFIEEQTNRTFRYRLRNVTLPNGEGPDTNIIDPNYYDLDGVKTVVPSGSFTTQHITLFQSGDCIIQYGQKLYSNLSDAKVFIQTEDYEAEANIAENGILRTYLIIKEGTTNLSDAINCEFIPVDKFGNVVGGAGVSLTYSSIIAGLGYIPENSSNKQNSLAPDGTGTKYPTLDIVSSSISSINVNLNLKEDKSNKTNNVAGNENSTSSYLSVSGSYSYFQQKLTDSNLGTFISTSLTPKTTPVDADYIVLSDSADSSKAKKILLSNFFTNYIKSKSDTEISYACSDEVSDLIVDTLITFRMPFGMNLTNTKLSLNTAPTLSKLIVDVKKNGTTIFSTLPSIDTGSTTSVSSSTPAVISNSNLSDDSIITIMTTQVGSGAAGKGLKVTFIGKRQ